MGFSQSYRCNSCGLGATVSGGDDCGFSVKTQTRYCGKCKTLVDVAIGLPWEDPLQQERSNESPKNDDKYGQCEKCNSLLEIVWCDGDPCPECGGTVVATGEQKINWD